MDNLWEPLEDLSPKRKAEISDICINERKDAALNAVVIGLKSMNHVHGYGLQRLSRLSILWGDEITRFYTSGGVRYRDCPASGLPDAGAVICNVDGRFSDLSDRRRRQILRLLDAQRRDAQWNAAMIGYETIRKELHFGDLRMEQLARQWEYDIRDFYQDRDINEPRLKTWIEDVGFIFEDGRLQAYRSKEGDALVKKSTAERRMEQEAEEHAEA